jgi:hypothetical protein
MTATDWTTANQRLLVAEFARIKARLTGEESPKVAEELEAARAAMSSPAAIDVLSEVFGLSAFERDVVLLCAAYEMEPDLIVGNATEDNSLLPIYPTFGLALARLVEPHWNAITPGAPLRANRLLELCGEGCVTSRRIELDERVLHFLAGVDQVDSRLQAVLEEMISVSPLAKPHEDQVRSAVESLEAEGTPRTVQISGGDRASRIEVARRICARLGLRLHVLEATAIPATMREALALIDLCHRETALLGSGLAVHAEALRPELLEHLARRASGPIFFVSAACVTIRNARHIQLPPLDAVAQKELWGESLGDVAESLNGSLDRVCVQFSLPASDIVAVAQELRQMPRTGELEAALWTTCQASARRQLDGLAQRVEANTGWRDLVLPDAQISTLRQIAAQERQRLKVHELWGFSRTASRGSGITVLFHGESGTGKTLAAEVLANELRLDLYRVDLASMVSKYIGETEKNLRNIFDAAEASGAILLFDEADALFGKRSEVKDSHDRFANIEVSYLLQRMEAYRGLAILTTNLKSALDPAFMRRLRFVVHFPFPDHCLRERIWRGVFPPTLPTDALDFPCLAQLSVAGGSIRNIALNAAFLAADADMPVGMPHLLQAARSEALKRERPFSDAETRGWS